MSRTRIRGMLTAARKLEEDIKVERKRSGELHMAYALHSTGMYVEWAIRDLERHQRNLRKDT